jgi:hypothetical protein
MSITILGSLNVPQSDRNIQQGIEYFCSTTLIIIIIIISSSSSSSSSSSINCNLDVTSC